jgi:hypothetical protein
MLCFCELVAMTTGHWLIVAQTLALFGSIIGYLIFSDVSYGLKYSENALHYRRYGAENLLFTGWRKIEFENITSVFANHKEDGYFISNNEIENIGVNFDNGDRFDIKTPFFEEDDLELLINYLNIKRPGVISYDVIQAFAR